MKGEHLRYWCHRCKRALVNDRDLKFADQRDTVTYQQHELRHDGCGGIVAYSKREAQIA
jgi:hypothetical protein